VVFFFLNVFIIKHKKDMKKVVRIKESELVNLIDKIITETTRKQKITEGVIKEDEIGMFHDPRMNSIHSFKDDDDKWENGALWVRITMLKNIIGIKDDEIAKINAVNLENKTWDEVKKIFNK